MHTEIVEVTPQLAGYWLSRNSNNRKLNEKRATKLALAMKRGEWQFNGDSIRISDKGVLLDGQHRLRAIEISGVAQKFIIVHGLPESVFTTIDTGTARNAAQMLQMDGIKNSTASASSANMYLTWIKTGKPKHGTFHKTPTQTEIFNFVKDNDDFEQAISRASGNKWLVKYGTPSIVCFCYYAFTIADAEKSKSFFDELSSGDFSYKQSPIKVLREMLIEDKGMQKRMSLELKAALFFKSFNMYRKGLESKILRLGSDLEGRFKL